eukprot:6488153-Amphidinium_carterae.1
MANITISLGHGLRGLLPGIPGTVNLLSLWENGVEGHLPHAVQRAVCIARCKKKGGRTLAGIAHASTQHSPGLWQQVLLQVTTPLWREINFKSIARSRWQPFCSAATCPNVDHAKRAANRHVLQ